MTDPTPASVKRVLSYASESIFVVALVMVTLLVSIGTFVRMNRLTNVAQFLPENTHAFVVVNAEDYLESVETLPNLFEDFLGQSLEELPWFKRDLALAWIDDEVLQFVEVNSKPQAKIFMDSLMIEDEVMISHQDYKCYEVSQPSCYTFRGHFLVIGPSEALEGLEPGLEADPNYQNVRNRLPYDTSLFAYVNADLVRQDFLTSLGEMSIWEPGYLESVLQIFPAYGIAVKMTPEEWTSESFIPVDKSVLGGAAFFHPKVKYHGDLAQFAPEGFQFEWSGTELHSQYITLMSHLEKLNSAASIVLGEEIQSIWAKHFGAASLEGFGPILDQEQLIAWTPNESMIWMLEIDNEEDRALALSLKDYFLASYKHSEPITNEKGEVLAQNQALDASKVDYKGDSYIQITANGVPRYFLAVLDDLAIASNNSEYFFETLDRWNGRADLRDLSQIRPVLLGADQSLRLDMTIYPESHIINLLLPGVETWINSTKTFDDGIYSRSILLY